jgi:ATP-dependent Clp protease adapter protein ClpS
VTTATALIDTNSKGWLRIAVVGGTSVYVHWSLPAGGLLVAGLGGLDPEKWIYYCVAYSILVAVHECGHLLAAVALHMKVYAVNISGFGGFCRIERPNGIWKGFFVFSAGLLAQAATLLMSIAYVHMYGTPSNNFGRAVINTFTLVNVALFVFNVIPGRGRRSGRATDGAVLWGLFLHAFLGRPHPMPPFSVKSVDEAPVFPPETRLLHLPRFRPDGFMYGIEILNDKTTPMEFVVSTLRAHLALSEREAILKMFEVHNNGGVLISIPTREGSIRIADAISADARAAGHTFTCRFVGD